MFSRVSVPSGEREAEITLARADSALCFSEKITFLEVRIGKIFNSSSKTAVSSMKYAANWSCTLLRSLRRFVVSTDQSSAK